MFIELTIKETGTDTGVEDKVFINTKHILCFMEDRKRGHTKVFDTTSDNSYFTVKESPAAILSLIS